MTALGLPLAIKCLCKYEFLLVLHSSHITSALIRNIGRNFERNAVVLRVLVVFFSNQLMLTAKPI